MDNIVRDLIKNDNVRASSEGHGWPAVQPDYTLTDWHHHFQPAGCDELLRGLCFIHCSY